MAFRHTGAVHPQTAFHPRALRDPRCAGLGRTRGGGACNRVGRCRLRKEGLGRRPEETIHRAVYAVAGEGEGDQHGTRCDAGKDEKAAAHC
jgi:hypothetical protein